MAQELKTQTPTPPVTPMPPARMTFEEFLEWADEDTYAEWVDGEVIMMCPATDWHQDLDDFLTALVRHFVEAGQLCRVFSNPILMRLPSRPSGREPDLIFVAKAHLNRLRTSYLDGPADLVVEIISPESRERDEVDKLREYEQAGVPEYWMLDPEQRWAR